MKVKLAFYHWLDKDGRVIHAYNDETLELIMGNYHSGTVFYAELNVDEEDAAELREALKQGYNPLFEVWAEDTEIQEQEDAILGEQETFTKEEGQAIQENFWELG